MGLFTSGVVYPLSSLFLIPCDILIEGAFRFLSVFLCCYLLEFGPFFLAVRYPPIL